MRKYWLILLVLACASSQAMAVTVQDLYAATVPVANKSAAARADALRRALAEVMVRVSGDPRVAQFAQADAILDRAQSLVQLYGYQQSNVAASRGKTPDKRGQAPDAKTNGSGSDETTKSRTSQSDETTAGLKLRAVFDGSALEAAMLEAGLPVWGSSRPVTMVWLLANGKLVTQAGPAEIVNAMKAAAERRGVPLRFPPAAAATSGPVKPADIRNGHIARLMMVSRGYGTEHVLTGHIDSQTAAWRLIEDGNVLSRWHARGEPPAALAASAVGHSAAVYARRYAAVGTEHGRVMVAIQGIGGGRGYTRVREFLAGLIAVEAVTPVLVDGKTVVFRITGPGDPEALDHRIGVVGWLEDNRLARNLAELYAGKMPALGYSISR